MDAEKQLELIKYGAAEIISEDDILARIKKRGSLRVKLGIDPSAPDIHLGISVVLRKLRQFQDLGHTAVLVVGDFTGMIGDPSGSSKTRPKLSREDVKKNMAKYKEQIFKILEPKRTEFTYNSKWLTTLTMFDLIELSAKYTVMRILERDDFTKRIKEGIPVYLHEILYPLFQGYDSVAVKADVELGGTDQKFNLLVGRELMREFGMEPQVIITMPILEGTDGVRKMSKSFGNYIGINEPARDMFGKIMSIPDELIVKYFTLATDAFPHSVAEHERAIQSGAVNPRDAKAELAKTIVRMYHSSRAAEAAAVEFDRVFARREQPENIREHVVHAVSLNIVDLLVEARLFTSRAEAKRKIREGAIDVDGVRIDAINHVVDLRKPVIVKVGKHRFIKVRH